MYNDDRLNALIYAKTLLQLPEEGENIMAKFKVGDKVRIRNLTPSAQVVEEEKKVSENKWAEVAAIFGLQLNEEFDIEGNEYNPYRFTERGLLDRENDNRSSHAMCLIGEYGEYKKIIKRPYRPKGGEDYWYVGDVGTVCSTINVRWMRDYLRISSGNCYRTREEAEAHVEEWKEKYKEFFND